MTAAQFGRCPCAARYSARPPSRPMALSTSEQGHPTYRAQPTERTSMQLILTVLSSGSLCHLSLQRPANRLLSSDPMAQSISDAATLFLRAESRRCAEMEIPDCGRNRIGPNCCERRHRLRRRTRQQTLHIQSTVCCGLLLPRRQPRRRSLSQRLIQCQIHFDLPSRLPCLYCRVTRA